METMISQSEMMKPKVQKFTMSEDHQKQQTIDLGPSRIQTLKWSDFKHWIVGYDLFNEFKSTTMNLNLNLRYYQEWPDIIEKN